MTASNRVGMVWIVWRIAKMKKAFQDHKKNWVQSLVLQRKGNKRRCGLRALAMEVVLQLQCLAVLGVGCGWFRGQVLGVSMGISARLRFVFWMIFRGLEPSIEVWRRRWWWARSLVCVGALWCCVGGLLGCCEKYYEWQMPSQEEMEAAAKRAMEGSFEDFAKNEQCRPGIDHGCVCVDPWNNPCSPSTKSKSCSCTRKKPVVLAPPPDFPPRKRPKPKPVSQEEPLSRPKEPARKGKAALSFRAVLGRNAGGQFAAHSPWSTPTLPGYRPAVGKFPGDALSPLVVMLCALEDTRCTAPLVLREVTAKERESKPLQGSFGPSVELSGLPAGEYRLMVFVDSLTSRALGYGWKDRFPNEQPDWGRVVSEGDLMLSDQDVRSGVNPQPVSRVVKLTRGSVTKLGRLTLNAFYERNLSAPVRSESGKIVVATAGGIRLVDLPTYTVRETVEGSQTFEHAMTDATGQPLAGDVCGLVDGPDELVYVLFQGKESGRAGFAVAFDVGVGRQVFGDHRVLFPGKGVPCRGVFHREGGRDYLFVTSAPSGRGSSQEASEGFWGASLSGLSKGDVKAVHHNAQTHDLFALGIDDIAAYKDRLYLSMTPDARGEKAAPAGAAGHHNIFVADFDARGAVSFVRDKKGKVVFRAVEPLGYTPKAPDGSKASNEEEVGRWSGLFVAPFHDGRTLLFAGGYQSIAVYALPGLERLKGGGDTPGKGGVKTHYFGTNITAFALSPDRKVLWAMPQEKSSYHFYFRRGTRGKRQTFNRLMALPIDLSQGSFPAVAEAFAGEDVDEFGGALPSGNVAPKKDPGVDLNYSAYQRYQVLWAPSTAGSTFGSAAFPVNQTMVVTRKSLWTRGGGARSSRSGGASGLGKGGDLGVFDLATRRGILFPLPGAEFYPFWSHGVREDPRMGFDLTPVGDKDQVTHGLVYKP